MDAHQARHRRRLLAPQIIDQVGHQATWAASSAISRIVLSLISRIISDLVPQIIVIAPGHAHMAHRVSPSIRALSTFFFSASRPAAHGKLRAFLLRCTRSYFSSFGVSSVASPSISSARSAIHWAAVIGLSDIRYFPTLASICQASRQCAGCLFLSQKIAAVVSGGTCSGRFIRDPDVRRDFVPLLYQQFDATPSARPAFFRLNEDLLPMVRSRTQMIPKLKKFRRPVRIIFGDADPSLNSGVARTFHEFFPGFELFLISGARHFVQLDEPEQVARLILAMPEPRSTPA
jgi:pimeloyl-ACP methyl ester carboxylesterase